MGLLRRMLSFSVPFLPEVQYDLSSRVIMLNNESRAAIDNRKECLIERIQSAYDGLDRAQLLIKFADKHHKTLGDVEDEHHIWLNSAINSIAEYAVLARIANDYDSVQELNASGNAQHPYDGTRYCEIMALYPGYRNMRGKQSERQFRQMIERVHKRLR
jgi:hypothetical protein